MEIGSEDGTLKERAKNRSEWLKYRDTNIPGARSLWRQTFIRWCL